MTPFADIKDLATPKLRELLRQLQPAQQRGLLRTLGRELETRWKEHFTRRDAEGNQAGFPRTHWWIREARDKTFVREGGDGTISVGVDSVQFAHKVLGGPIFPRAGRRALTIPLTAAAAATQPRAVPGLFVLKLKSTNAAYLATREGGGLRLYWRLVPGVRQYADARALPPTSELRAALEARAQVEIERMVAQAK